MIDENLNFYNYSTETKFKFSKEMKLWLDKCNTLFWWWMNAYLDNEASEIYKCLISMIENINHDTWYSKDFKKNIFDFDIQLSNLLKNENIMHYTIPFSDRADIAILYKNDITVEKEMLDEH